METILSVNESSQKSKRLPGFCALLLACFLISSPSFAQSVQGTCPKGYSVFETVCLDEKTGDVVNQSRSKSAAESSSTVSSAAPKPDKANAAASTGR